MTGVRGKVGFSIGVRGEVGLLIVVRGRMVFMIGVWVYEWS